MRECPDWIDSYLKLTENTEPPELFHKWVAISCIAACMQRKCVLPWGRLRFYPNMYVVLIAPPGRARKGTAMDPVMQFLEEPRLNIHLAAEAVTREQLIRELESSTDMLTDINGIVTSHSSLTICNSELTVFLGYRNPQLIDDLTDWYDCKRRWRYRTKNSGSNEVVGVWVNMLGATTPDLLRSSLPPVAIGGGLTSRMVFVFAGAKRRTIPDPFLSRADVELEEKLLNDLERIVMLCGEYRPTADFVSAYTEWYMTNDNNPPFRDVLFAGYCERRPAMVMKLSVIMAASHSDELVVTGDDFLRGVQILEEVEHVMPMALSGIGQGKHADVLARLMAWLEQKRELSLAEILYEYRNDVTQWELDRMIQSLESMQFCVYISNTHRLIYNEEFRNR